MLVAPSTLDKKQLKDIHIDLDLPKEKEKSEK